jgi:hypothetical protein
MAVLAGRGILDVQRGFANHNAGTTTHAQRKALKQPRYAQQAVKRRKQGLVTIATSLQKPMASINPIAYLNAWY